MSQRWAVKAGVLPLLSPFPPGRRAALDRLATIRPDRYARTRNDLDGAVTRLSPYLRHGILDLAEVRDAVIARMRSRSAGEKLLQELAWRDYYRRVYGAIGERVWDDIEPYKTGWAAASYARELPDDIRMARTDAACIDGFVHDLVDTGYVHNHARMYFASYVVHHRRVRWQAGAAFYLEHLLDGDPASNNLSWQWIASTFAHAPYIFNRANLERYTNAQYCRTCPLASGGCPFDATYEELDTRLFPKKDGNDSRSVGPASVDLHVPPDAPAAVPPNAERVVIWAHPDALSDATVARRAFPEAPVLFAGDRALRTRERWSEQRVAFIEGTLADMRIDARSEGDAANDLLAFARRHDAQVIITTATVDPTLRAIAAASRAEIPVSALAPRAFAMLERTTDLRRFSRYWRQIEAQLFAEHEERRPAP